MEFLLGLILTTSIFFGTLTMAMDAEDLNVKGLVQLIHDQGPAIENLYKIASNSNHPQQTMALKRIQDLYTSGELELPYRMDLQVLQYIGGGHTISSTIRECHIGGFTFHDLLTTYARNPNEVPNYLARILNYSVQIYLFIQMGILPESIRYISPNELSSLQIDPSHIMANITSLLNEIKSLEISIKRKIEILTKELPPLTQQTKKMSNYLKEREQEVTTLQLPDQSDIYPLMDGFRRINVYVMANNTAHGAAINISAKTIDTILKNKVVIVEKNSTKFILDIPEKTTELSIRLGAHETTRRISLDNIDKNELIIEINSGTYEEYVQFQLYSGAVHTNIFAGCF